MRKSVIIVALLFLQIVSVQFAFSQCPGVMIWDVNDVNRTSYACLGETQTFQQQNTAPGMLYTWSASGGTIVSPNGTPTISVLWNTPGNGSIDLTITGPGCYDYNYVQHTTIQQIAPPIQGPTLVCGNDSAMYVTNWHHGLNIAQYSGWWTCTGAIYQYNSVLAPNWYMDDTIWVDWSTVPPGSPRTVSFHYSNFANGCVGTTTLTVNTYAPGLPALGPDQNLCSPGDTAFLDAGPGYSGYLWNTNSTMQQIAVTSPGTYWVDVSDTNGCNGSDTVDVIPIGNPPVVSLGADTSVCPGNPVTFDAGSGFASYAWTSSATGQTISPSSPGQYAVTVTDSGGCTASDTVELFNLPAATVNLGPDQTVCPGASATFDAGPGYTSYLWSDNSTAQTLTSSVPGTYSVTVTNSNGCTASDTALLSNFPAATVNFGPDQTVCPGASVTFDAGPGYTSYLWSDNSTAQTLTSSVPGSYSVTVTNSNGCTASDTALLSNFPAATVNLGPDQTVCPGASATFDAGPGYTSYLWSDNSTAQTLTSSVPGTYSVTVTNSNGCTASDTALLSNFPAASVNLGPDQTVCPGASATFDAGPGYTSYLWSDNSTAQTLTTSVSGTYSVTVTNSNGCTASDTALLSNFPAATVNLGPDQTVCPGASATFDAGPGYTSYLWSDNSTAQTLTSSVSGSYSVTVTNSNGCTASDTALLSNFPAATVNLGPDQTVCPGASATFDAGPGYASYLWSDNSTAQTLTSSVSGSYSVTVTNSNGCTASDTALLSNFPAATVNLGPDQTVCPGATATFNAGPGYTSYLWSDNSTAQTLTSSVSGSYSVTVTNSNGCTASDTVALFILPGTTVNLGPDTTICTDTTLALNAGPGYVSYLWSDNSTGQSLIANPGLLYWVETTDANNCISRDSIMVNENTDCVWPGDNNHDGIANNLDLISIGVAFGSTGPLRPNATQSWHGQPCPDWSQTFPGNLNYKHADSDGNGIVNNADTLAITANYGLTHNRTGGAGTGIPLYLKADQDTVVRSNLISVGLYLGDAQTFAVAVYGVALTLEFDPSQVELTTVGLEYPSSFLGSQGVNLITLTKPFLNSGKVDLALSRNSQTNVSGLGRIGTLYLHADSNYWSGQTMVPVPVHISNAQLIGYPYESFNLDVWGDTVMVTNFPNATETGFLPGVSIYPNPTGSAFWVEMRMDAGEPVTLTLSDITGRVTTLVRSTSENGHFRRSMSVESLSNGIYLLEVRSGSRRAIKKVHVLH